MNTHAATIQIRDCVEIKSPTTKAERWIAKHNVDRKSGVRGWFTSRGTQSVHVRTSDQGFSGPITRPGLLVMRMRKEMNVTGVFPGCGSAELWLYEDFNASCGAQSSGQANTSAFTLSLVPSVGMFLLDVDEAGTGDLPYESATDGLSQAPSLSTGLATTRQQCWKLGS
jgi:hypothetical protein